MPLLVDADALDPYPRQNRTSSVSDIGIIASL